MVSRRPALPRFDGPAPLVMGILNVTPDSFSDGGRFDAVEAAVAQAQVIAAEGAALIDIGGESTRPGFTPVSMEEECARVLPVLDALGPAYPLPISVDTSKAAVARQALAHGAAVINDIWGLQGDAAMAGVVADAGATVVVMHNRATADPALDIVADLERFFAGSIDIARSAGIPSHRILLDPGIGFGKTPAQQIEAVRAIPLLRGRFGLPILTGLSRKSVLNHITGSALDNRLPDTIAANLAAFSGGATVFRVHDVAAHVAAFAVFANLRPATVP
jgi:dihydropteroate synthase